MVNGQTSEEETVAQDIAAIGRLNAVPTILQAIAALTGLGLTLVARVTPTSWTACAVNDRIAFGLAPGDTLELTTTFCNEVRQSAKSIVIEHASSEPAYCEHPAPKMYGFESYISVPIFRRSGEIFGTLCGLDPSPRTLRDEKTRTTLELFARLISLQLDAEETLSRSEAALTTEKETAGLRDQFMAILGHDLRNPLSSILMGSKILLGQPLPPTSIAIVERVHRSARRIEHLADDMLDLARVQLGGGLPMTAGDVADLPQVLRHVVEELASAHPDREIRLQAGEVGTVRCDRRRIEQVASNLIANAVAHGDPTAPIEVSLRAADGEVSLEVRNQGQVIPQAVLARIFEPFYRSADDAASGGLGLGLFIVAEIARSHGGRTSATSSAEAGTIFTFTLPH